MVKTQGYNAGVAGSIPGWGTPTSHRVWSKTNKNPREAGGEAGARKSSSSQSKEVDVG